MYIVKSKATILKMKQKHIANEAIEETVWNHKNTQLTKKKAGK